MPLKFLSKKFFPGEADWQRRKQFKTLIWVVFTAICLGCIIGGVMLYYDKK